MGDLFKKYIMRGIDDAEIQHRLEFMYPVAEKEPRAGLRRIIIDDMSISDIRGRAYMWEPKWGSPVSLVEFGRRASFHTFGAPSIFKPSLAEAVAQIPTEFQRLRVVAFEILPPDPPVQLVYLLEDGTIAVDASRDRLKDCETLHMGTCVLYQLSR